MRTLHHALRTPARTPALAAVAVLSLALGFGAAAAYLPARRAARVGPMRALRYE